jgi:glycolate dehydrogenase FAD-binding subunit
VTSRGRTLELADRIGELTGATRSGAPLPLVAPKTEDALTELVHRARRDRLKLLPLGRGTQLGWTNLATDADLAVSMRELTGIVAHEPDDGTITALAGTPYGELWDRARAGGHHLSPELPAAHDSTLGGVIAAGRSGVDRLRLGPLRHQLLGTRALLADGTITKSGGRLVKNVTGFDLHRLYCGSQGSLCFLLEASLRLYPAPEAVCHLVLDVTDVRAALAVAHELQATRLAPWILAIDADGPTGPAHLHLELAGRAAVVAKERATLPATWNTAQVSEGDAAARAHRVYVESGVQGAALVRIHLRPSRVETAWKRCAALIGPDSPLRYLRLEPALAALELILDSSDPQRVAALVTELRAALADTGSQLRVGGDAALRARVDCFDETGPALPWMRQLRERFDPHGLFATGRGPAGL